LLAARIALLLCFGLTSCASGEDDGGSSGGDDGSPAQGPADGSAGDSGLGGHDATSTSDVATTDTSTGGGEASFESGADTSTADVATISDSASPGDTGIPGDSSSTCPQHGFSGALVTFDLTSETGSEASVSATTTAAGITGGVLARAAGLSAVSGAGSINSSGWSTATMADKTLYYTFSVTPAAGCTVALASLAIQTAASGTGPAHFDVGTSVDNYTALSTAYAGTSMDTVTLSASAAGAITVHVFGYGATSSAGTMRIESTLSLTGSIE
jgi:hypothetical protein